MSRRPQELLPLKTDVVLVLLALAGTPRHGYAIMREVAERSSGEVVLQAGALYRHLKRMLAEGLIEEVPAPAGAVGSDPRRRYYRVTAFGGSVLDAEVRRMSALVRAARLTAAGKRPRLA
jgi:DNA-binding PadR family transcriptional regulator